MAITGISADLLTSWATLKSGGAAASTSGAATPAAHVKAPWDTSNKQVPATALVSNALSGKTFFNAADKAFSITGATTDEKKLFALYSGLNTLAALAGAYGGANSAQQTQINNA